MDWCQPTEHLLQRLPTVGGAYALRFDVARTLCLPITRLGGPTLPSGTYVYCGSAYGPGGIAARVQRHLRAGNRPHWHVDYLTQHAPISAIAWLEGGRECDLLAGFLAAGATLPVKGFGSSDCRRCHAHLVRL